MTTLSYCKGLPTPANELNALGFTPLEMFLTSYSPVFHTLIGKLKSIEKWIGKTEKKLKNARKFYSKKSWINSKSGCVFPLSCSIRFHDTNWQNLRFQLHNKKRRKYHLTRLQLTLKICAYPGENSSLSSIYRWLQG